MIAQIEPANAEDETVTWSADDSSKATISTDGLLTAKKLGNVTVNCTPMKEVI